MSQLMHSSAGKRVTNLFAQEGKLYPFFTIEIIATGFLLQSDTTL